jgi:hypothetical protein
MVEVTVVVEWEMVGAMVEVDWEVVGAFVLVDCEVACALVVVVLGVMLKLEGAGKKILEAGVWEEMRLEVGT